MAEQDVSVKMRKISYWAAVTIVMIHAGEYFHYAKVPWDSETTIANNMQGFLHSIGVFSMSWFFFQTAYFFFYNYASRSYKDMIIKKLKSLLVPYILWNLFMFLYNFLLNLRVGKIDFSFWGFLKSFVFLYCPGIKMIAPINLPTWYIIRIFTYFLVSPLVYKIILKRKLWIIIEILLISAIFGLNIRYYSFLYWLPMFLFGGFISVHHKDAFESFIKGKTLISSKPINILVQNFIVAGIYVVGGLLSFMFSIHVGIRRYLGIFGIFLLVRYYTPMLKMRWAEEHASFFIYCAHFPAINFCVRAYNQVSSLKGTLLEYILLVTASIVLCEIAALFLNQFLKPVYRVINGGR